MNAFGSQKRPETSQKCSLRDCEHIPALLLVPAYSRKTIFRLSLKRIHHQASQIQPRLIATSQLLKKPKTKRQLHLKMPVKTLSAGTLDLHQKILFTICFMAPTKVLQNKVEHFNVFTLHRDSQVSTGGMRKYSTSLFPPSCQPN